MTPFTFGIKARQWRMRLSRGKARGKQ
jgi:hypothetical protein